MSLYPLFFYHFHRQPSQLQVPHKVLTLKSYSSFHTLPEFTRFVQLDFNFYKIPYNDISVKNPSYFISFLNIKMSKASLEDSTCFLSLPINYFCQNLTHYSHVACTAITAPKDNIPHSHAYHSSYLSIGHA